MPTEAIDTARQQRAFLKAYKASGRRLGRATAEARINKSAHYSWLKRDPGYAVMFRALEPQTDLRKETGKRRLLFYRKSHRPLLRAFLEAYKKLKSNFRFTHRVRHITAAKNAGIKLKQLGRWFRRDPEYQRKYNRLQMECIHAQQSAFLRAYGKFGRIDLAAPEAGINARRHEYWMRADRQYVS